MGLDDFNLSDFLPYRLAVIAERVSRRLALEYGRTHGLSVAEWRVLAQLSRSPMVSVREIHNCVNLDKPRVSRAVARLESAGLVTKTASETDSRLVSISLSAAGRTALEEIVPKALAYEARLLGVLSDAEREVFVGLIEKLHAVLDADPEARARASMDLG